MSSERKGVVLEVYGLTFFGCCRALGSFLKYQVDQGIL